MQFLTYARQVSDLFPTCRQYLFAPFHAEIQAKTIHVPLLGLSSERTSSWNRKI